MKESFPDRLTEDALKTLIQDHCVVAWNLPQREESLNEWLNNFDGSALGDYKYERKLALWILLHFTFYTDEEIRGLCRVAHAKYIHAELMRLYKNGDLNNQSIEQCKLNILKDTLFVPAGVPSESGGHISYIYRQANDLSKSYFDPSRANDVNRIVILDDVSISGHQASGYIEQIPAQKGQSKFFIPLFITENAKQELHQNHPELIIISPVLIDSRSKCFSEDSFVFNSPWSKELAKDALSMCSYYGSKIVEGSEEMGSYPLGFSNGQMLIGLPHNVPNNSLPIIWHDGHEWKPFKARHHKKYGLFGEDEKDSTAYV